MTTEEAGKILGLAPDTVASYCRTGRLAARKVSGLRNPRWDIPRRVVLAYADGQQAIRTAIYCPDCEEFYPATKEGDTCPRCGRYDRGFTVTPYDWDLFPYDWDAISRS